MRGLKIAAAAAAVLGLATQSAFAGSGMTVGAVEDAAKWGDPAAKMGLAKNAGFGAVRMTLQWSSGQTAPTAGELQNTLNAANAARAAGIEPIVAIYNVGSSSTPNTTDLRAQFVQFAVAAVNGLPSVERFVIGNEPNINRYWLPQFNADGTDAAAPAYEALLADAYDAIKAARPSAIVIGGATAPRGEDSATSTRPTHSPTAFIQDLGAAYRATGRTAPIMDVYDHHVYQDYSSLPPSYEHPNSKTISVPDYGKLVSVLGTAFDGTAQRGSTLPIIYGEFGVESIIPSAKASIYTGTEPSTTKPADETMQGDYYTEAFKLALCQPNVIGIMVFHVSDESSLAAWQSGPYYADDTPKSSLGAIRDAATAARGGTLTTCPDQVAPNVALTAPAAGTVTGGTVTLSANASDNVGIGKVEFLVNGTVVGSKSIKPYSIAWKSAPTTGPVTITARAQDAVRNVGVSQPVSITLDNAPPDTVITTSPGTASGDSVSFAFGSTKTPSSFECSLDGAVYAACTSPKSYASLVPGSHTFSVRAIDAYGNVDPTPALYTWTSVDSTPPDTTITAATTSGASATFSFSATEAGTFQCSLDAAAYAACASPQSYAALGIGPHTFRVVATDAAGNVDPTAASSTWTVRPANDMFAAAQAVSGASGSVSGVSRYATKETGEPAHAGNAGGASVWYRWTAPTNGWLTVDTVGSSFNTLLGVYQGSPVSALYVVASNNDAAYGVTTSRVRFKVFAGTTYSFAVDGAAGATGAITLRWAYS